ncbi:class I SAM-dependent methyltransferase [Mycobacterium sp. URHB0021]|jgi:ubiquinone/menaquinone biosynthesis C-methylase UbiE
MTELQSLGQTWNSLGQINPMWAILTGCGLGRLTQPLADYFQEAVGVDIAAGMIEGAPASNRRGARCEFVHNDHDDLAIFDDGAFDFTFSHLVLQHMPPTLAERYMTEFVRVRKPGGTGYFQMTEYSRNPVKRFIMKHAPHEELYWLLRHGTRAPFRTPVISTIVASVTAAGAQVVGVRTRAYGAGKLWLDHRVVLRKPLSVTAE